MSKRLLSELQVNLNYLSAVERRIAGAILEDPRKFITFSMSDLAEYVSVSHGSIINFANKFAGGGFPKLKLQIAADLREYEQQPFSSFTNADGVQDVLDKTIRGTNQAFHHTLKLNSEATLRSVVSLILNARKVEIYGVFR